MGLLLLMGGADVKPVLDVYTGAAAGYSLRKIRTAYSGSAVRVRRSSDSAEQDIGFAGSLIDTAALTSFCSGANGFVVTWYDQTGNNRHVTKSTALQQPKIFDSSTGVVLDGGRPAVYSDGTTSLFCEPSPFPATGDIAFDIFSVCNRASGTDQLHLLGITDLTPPTDRRIVAVYGVDSATQRSVRLYGGFTTYNSTFSGRTALNVNYAGSGGAINAIVKKNTLTVAGFSNTGLNIQATAAFKLFGIGTSTAGAAATNASAGAVGYIQEAIFYLSSQSSRVQIQDNQMRYWGVS